MKRFFLYLFMLCSLGLHAQQSLNSFASAAPVVYLDFDGEEVNSPLWNGGAPLVCQPAALNSAQQEEVFRRVAEDFTPFEINVTTSKAVFEAAPIHQRMRVIITPTSNWFPGVGGIAYIGSFSWGDDTPCFAFSDKLNNNVKMIAECCSHETGHTLGLSHQSSYNSECQLTATYNAGTGDGETSWAPVMGNSYYKNMTSWNNGPTPFGCANHQDNLTIITTQNGFGYRVDDCPDDLSASPVVINLGSNVQRDGVISTSWDKDAYRFSLARNANFKLSAVPQSAGINSEGANLDIRLSLYNGNRELVKVYDPAQTLSAEIDTVLNQGEYYLVIDGTGNQNTSDYGSLGAYRINIINTVLPVCNISFTGSVLAGSHQFTWAVFCEERLLSASVESSVDGSIFTPVLSLSGLGGRFQLLPQSNAAQYYRIKVETFSGRTVYSAIVQLRGLASEGAAAYLATTFVQQQITLQAAQAGYYILSNTNGQPLQKGAVIKGFNNIDVSRYPPGLYLVQLGGSVQQTLRVVKQ
jgi:hypothetical protein